MPETFDVVICHDPACGTSRNTLALIRRAGLEPHGVEDLKTPPSRALIGQLAARAGLTVLREKGTPFAELGLGDLALTDARRLDALEAHPILLNRPLMASPKGVRLCRPAEAVLDLLPAERGAFAEEEGEGVVDLRGAPKSAPERLGS